MKALSFRDPWGWLVALGLKDVENRNWSTKFRGRIYIHISKTFDLDGLDWILYNTALPRETRELALRMDWPRVRGAIIGEVDIIDCVKKSDSPWFVGKFGLVLSNPVLYPVPIPCKGKLRFFEVSL
ncbi:MAG: ASCH domain-containing protein [Dehalococcoidales bacterium]|nr:ASCH domain-containing protein [Dehalococcoidales bacterium]